VSDRDDEQPLAALLKRGLDKGRLEALTDGIIAVAMTLLVLDLKLDGTENISTDAHLLSHLLEIERTFNVYLVSFIVLGMYWIAHSLQFQFVRHVDRGMIWISLAFMLLVTLVPFTTNVMISYDELLVPIVLYGVNLFLLACTLILNINYLARHPALAEPGLTNEVVSFIHRRLVLFSLIPVLAICAAFVHPRLGLSAYFLMLVMHFFPHRVDGALRRLPGRKVP
jgi:uncharacterized membrane protein